MGYNKMSEDEIRAAIIRVARESFMRVGIEKSMMNNIAKGAGVSRSTLYLYYPSKANLTFVIAMEEIESMTRLAEKYVRTSGAISGFEKMCGYVESFIQYYRDNECFVRFINEFDTIYSSAYPNIEEAHAYSLQMAKDIGILYGYISEGQEDGSIRADIPSNLLGSILADGLFGLLQRILPRKEHIEQEHSVSVDEVIRLYASFMESSFRRI